MPLRYHFSSGVKTKVPARSSSLPSHAQWSSDAKCNQCKTQLGTGGYTCLRCSPPHNLVGDYLIFMPKLCSIFINHHQMQCLGCSERNAREAHYARYGSGHEMEFTAEKFECGVCLSVAMGTFVHCDKCEKDAPDMAVMVCFHRPLTTHSLLNLFSAQIVRQTIRIFVIM